MGQFSGLGNELALKLALAVQGVLVLFFVVSPLMGGLIHRQVAKRSTLVMVVAVMALIGNLIYMAMVHIARRHIPETAISDFAWILMSFLTAFSISWLVARYLYWILSDNFYPAEWVREYEELTDEDMLPFDRRRKQEMERRKKSRRE